MPRKPRRRARARSVVPGLTRRGARAYWGRTLPEAVGGDRIAKSLDADWGSEPALARAGALNTLYDRGDWPILRRWAEGQLHISELQRAVRDGDWRRLARLNADGPLLGPEVDAHLQRVEATRAPHTAAMHRAVCGALRARLGDDYPMAQLPVAECEAFLHEPKPGARSGATAPAREDWKPWASNTQRFYRMVAGALWRGAQEREAEACELANAHPALTANPWRKAKIKETWSAPPAVLTEAEIRALLAHPQVAGTPTEALLALAAWAGLRRAELVHQRMGEDVDLDGAFVWVQTRTGEHEWRTKTRRSQRKVTLPAHLVDTLRRHVAAGYAGTRYLFRAPHSERPLHVATADRWARAAYTAAGLKWGREGEGLTLHSLRHSHITLLLSKGVSVAKVAARVGDTVKVVVDTYAHWIPDDEARALAVLEMAGRPTP